MKEEENSEQILNSAQIAPLFYQASFMVNKVRCGSRVHRLRLAGVTLSRFYWCCFPNKFDRLINFILLLHRKIFGEKEGTNSSSN